MLIEISNRTTARKTGNSRVRGSELNHGHVKKKAENSQRISTYHNLMFLIEKVGRIPCERSRSVTKKLNPAK